MAPARAEGLFVEFIESDGSIARADPRIWQPVAEEEVLAWLNTHFSALRAAEKRVFSQETLARANRLRRRFRKGQKAPNEWLLGPLAAPYHFCAFEPGPRNADPVALLVTRVSWSPERRAVDPSTVVREVIYDSRTP
jgi:hypothetical protein